MDTTPTVDVEITARAGFTSTDPAGLLAEIATCDDPVRAAAGAHALAAAVVAWANDLATPVGSLRPYAGARIWGGRVGEALADAGVEVNGSVADASDGHLRAAAIYADLTTDPDAVTNRVYVRDTKLRALTYVQGTAPTSMVPAPDSAYDVAVDLRSYLELANDATTATALGAYLTERGIIDDPAAVRPDDGYWTKVRASDRDHAEIVAAGIADWQRSLVATRAAARRAAAR